MLEVVVHVTGERMGSSGPPPRVVGPYYSRGTVLSTETPNLREIIAGRVSCTPAKLQRMPG